MNRRTALIFNARGSDAPLEEVASRGGRGRNSGRKAEPETLNAERRTLKVEDGMPADSTGIPHSAAGDRHAGVGRASHEPDLSARCRDAGAANAGQFHQVRYVWSRCKGGREHRARTVVFAASYDEAVRIFRCAAPHVSVLP